MDSGSRLTEALSAHPQFRRVLHIGIVVLASAVVVALTHDVPYLLSWPLWGDEAWVVITRKFPLSDLPQLISSTPIGWNWAVQGFAVLGDQGGRVLVQLFNMLAVAVGYFIGREVASSPSRAQVALSGVAVALAVALTPATLTRLDIKHYTADTFVALLIFYLVIRQVRRPARSSLIALTIVSALALCTSLAAVFPIGAAYAALGLHSAISRDWKGFRTIAVAAAIAAAGIAAWYFSFYTNGDISALREFWTASYPRSILHVPTFVGSSLILIDNETIFRTVWVIIPLVTVGTVMLWRKRWIAISAFGPLMLGLMIVLGVARRYPLLDARTSHFFLIFTSVLCVLTVILIIEWLASRWSRYTRLANLALAALIALMVALAIPLANAHTLPQYDTGNQARYVEEHLKPGDLVLYNQLASYQLGMTWTRDAPSWCPDQRAWTGFNVCYPGVDDFLPYWSLEEAYALIDAHLRENPESRIWLIRSHVFYEYEQMEGELPEMYDYELIGLPIQPVGVIYGFAGDSR